MASDSDDLLEHLADLPLDMRMQFVRFLSELRSMFPDENLSDYQPPHGTLSARVMHLLHWPPSNSTVPAFSGIDWRCASMKIVSEMFPQARDKDACHDLWCRRERHGTDMDTVCV